ncbi:MAG TPA: hypothetical protein VMW72_03885, partial [Sedimentisphaerales bacterium]|nr:hypothetical protein [Sedimentisphaerales bacterium]
IQWFYPIRYLQVLPRNKPNHEKEKSLSDSEKVLHSIDLCMMVIWNLSKRSLLSHLLAMYMTVRLMVIDAQEMLAVRKRAFSAINRSL